MTKLSLLSALTALLILPSIAIAATTADLDDGPNSTWPAVLTLALKADGASSQGSQSFSMNVTALPASGSTYRVYKTTANGQNFWANPVPMVLGDNTTTVGGVTFDRTVKIQFSSDAIEFDALTVNGADAMPGGVAPSEGTQGIGQSISASGNLFDQGTNATWVAVHTLTTAAEGSSSQVQQTLSINVTYIPEGGANYRVFKTNSTGQSVFGSPEAIVLGDNAIGPVSGVNFDRTVKIQFSSNAIEFDGLEANGTILWPIPALGTQGAGQPISAIGNYFDEGPNETWVEVHTLTTAAEGSASQGAQSLSMNVTYIPAGGANYRVYKTTADGSDFFGSAQALVLGDNTIGPVAGVNFDRTVKIQFSSSSVEFDALAANTTTLWPIDTSGSKVTLANSNLFNSTSDASWVSALTTAVRQDGAPSQSAQTVEIYVTALPSGGANYRVYKTNEASQPVFGDEQALYLGDNTITVAAPGNAFDRVVKIQFSSDAVEYNALNVNGVARVIGATVTEAPSVSIDGTTLSWTETDGTTLQFSEDLDSWTSLPSASSPYSPSTSPDRFYRTISEE